LCGWSLLFGKAVKTDQIHIRICLRMQYQGGVSGYVNCRGRTNNSQQQKKDYFRMVFPEILMTDSVKLPGCLLGIAELSPTYGLT